jgi:phage shock protein E
MKLSIDVKSQLSALAVCAVVFAAVSYSIDADEMGADGVVYVQAAGAAKLVREQKVTVLDVRTADQFEHGHIAGAQNIDFCKISEFEAKLKEMDKSKPYLVHCQLGARSRKSLKVFKKLGFETIYYLEGGLGAWQAAGKPVQE